MGRRVQVRWMCRYLLWVVHAVECVDFKRFTLKRNTGTENTADVREKTQRKGIQVLVLYRSQLGLFQVEDASPLVPSTPQLWLTGGNSCMFYVPKNINITSCFSYKLYICGSCSLLTALCLDSNMLCVIKPAARWIISISSSSSNTSDTNILQHPQREVGRKLSSLTGRKVPVNVDVNVYVTRQSWCDLI